jgi:hypothetical protein
MLAIVGLVTVLALVLVADTVGWAQSTSFNAGYNAAHRRSAVISKPGPPSATRCHQWASAGDIPAGEIWTEWIHGCTAYLNTHHARR